MRVKRSSSPMLSAVTVGVLLGLSTLMTAHAAPPKRPESQQEFWARYDKRDWSAAIEEARRLVETARANTQQPLALANALTLLGNSQLSGGDKVNAETSYREALQITEAQVGGADPALLDPLRGLGYTLALLERHEEAVPILERALIVSRRSFGLFDLGQQGLLRQLASSLSQIGRMTDAHKQMLYLQRVGERTYGDNDPRMAPLLCIIGDFYVDTGNFLPGRDRYRDALQIIEKKLGKNDPALVQPLRGLARSYVQEIFFITQGYEPLQDRASMDPQANDPRGLNPKYLSADGERAIQRALAILDARPDTTPAVLTDTLIQFGDWYQIKHQPEKSLPYYQRAAALVASIDTSSPEAAAAPLSFPVRLYYPLPPLAMRNRQLPPQQTDEKFVSVQFTVTTTGDVADAKVVEQNGSQRQASEALQAIRASRYRPKFVDGQAVETQGVVTREVFKIRKQEDEEGKS
ncbi:TonB family protein [Steroidobacter sp.]|uniref:TonB family protein n=1 Tax=Steroidobacter sp. TaxID=1978227 RepID=UPI0025ED0BE8|nr:TonB family protein [Steroidobacter sp.]